MNREKKISVRTPSTVYVELMQRAYELDLNHREYYLALAIKDMEQAKEGEGITLEEAKDLKERIKKLSKQSK